MTLINALSLIAIGSFSCILQLINRLISYVVRLLLLAACVISCMDKLKFDMFIGKELYKSISLTVSAI
ncbi:hypothetical protein [Rickettsia oklahomensis]|uniref:Uncharacterized protein n=1 Tax=Rickettsia oklahomensis TaxID=3141789 RepID=A0AAU7BZ23_9RICK